MIGEVFGRCAGIIVVHITMVIIMVMCGADQMVDFVRDVECTGRRIPSALHRKAMQGQKEHQENAKKTAQGNRLRKVLLGYTSTPFRASALLLFKE
ncbi:MAG TPA: hypothetical protein VGE12_05200 [Noviherbaspirillum sp.]